MHITPTSCTRIMPSDVVLEEAYDYDDNLGLSNDIAIDDKYLVL